MKRLILALLILCSTLPAFAQPASGDILGPVGGPTDFWFTGCLLTSQRQMRMTYSDTLVLLYNPAGSFRFDTTRQLMRVYDGSYWRRMVDSAYLDTIIAGVEAGVADTAQFIASIYRLNREIDSVSNIIDSNNAIIYSNIATLQGDVVTIDSAVGVAFGAISALYDTLPNYVDTAQLNDSLQAIKDRDVPYIGATTDVNLGTYNILPNSVRLSTTPTGTLTNVGQLYWDATNVTPSVPLNANVTLQMGQEMYIRARNNTGAQINDGQVVYVNDAQGNTPTIALANSDSVSSSIVIGVATENIADNSTGFVTTFGVVNGFNTSGFSDGDALYLNTVSGQLSNTIPPPPHKVVKVGIALNTTVNGKIFVQPANPIGQDTTFTAPYNSNKIAPTQKSVGTFVTNTVNDTAAALRAELNTKGSGTVTSIQFVAGTGVTITPTTAVTTSGVYTISATGGGGGSPVLGTPYHLLFPSGTDTLKTTDKLYIDTTDNRLVFTNDTTTTTVNADPNGGTKVLNSNRMGMSALRLLDTVSIPAALQRALNAQTASLMFPVFPGIAFTNNYLYTGMLSTVGTPSYVVAAYNSTIQHLNWNKYLLTTASGANSNALIRTTGITSSSGIICGNTKYSGGGGRGTFMFSLPTYLSTERIMIGYVGAGVAAISTDPSSMVGSTASLLLIKDAADATLSFMHTNTSGGAATKVNTGITPNSEDVYRLTVYIAPNSTYYMQLEVLSKSAPTTVVTINPTTAIPPVGSRMVSYQGVNNGSAGGVISYGIIQVMEEIY